MRRPGRLSGGTGPPDRSLPRPVRRAHRFLKGHWQGLTVLVLALAVGVAAYLSPGLVRADVRLEGGTVYVVKRDSGLVGMVNTQIDQLASAAAAGDSQTEVLQHEDTVLLHLPQSSRITLYNPARNTLGELTQLPSNAGLQLVGDQLLVYNSESGRLWHGDVRTVLGYDFQRQKADLEIGEHGVATLTTDGHVIGLDPDRSVLVRPDGEGREVALPFRVDPLAEDLELSAVGNKAVVLDRTLGLIWLEGMDSAFDVSGAGTARLAAPMPDALGGDEGTRALYATKAGLIALTADGPRSLSGQLDASPVAPVQVGDCVYGAFHAGDGAVTWAKRCKGSDAAVASLGESANDGSGLSLQVNRGEVALNDAADGTTWLLDKGTVIRRADWEAVAPRVDGDETVTPDGDAEATPDRSDVNRPPVASDDTLAARAGRSTVLPILDNDTDPDGDVLSISAPTNLDGATLEPVASGAGLQITLPNDASGSLSFTYTVDDGRGGTDSATARVSVVDADISRANSAPHQRTVVHPLTVQLGAKSVTRRALLDWRDPDGDPLMLVSATIAAPHDDLVRFTADGQITYTDVGKTTGTKEIDVVVSDGRAQTTGTLRVVVTEDPVGPVAHGDFVSGIASQPIQVDPLANDIGSGLTLSEVTTDCADCILNPNYRDRTFTFEASEPGTYYATYTVTNGQAGTGLVRIDVAAGGANRVPVAALDVALLPPGGSVRVDPLLNDTDPDGDVLVIQTYQAPSPLNVVMDRRHLMSITAQHTPEAPLTITYRVSDGRHSVVGTIVVIPAVGTGTTAPRTEDDEVRVRAGGAASIDVLDNDSSPLGLDLHVGELTENPLGSRAWSDGERVRVSVPAGTPAGSSTLSYTAVDSEGRSGTARVVVTVVTEEAQNEPPAPTQVIDRVLAGTTTRIPIPLDGIDPNGDAVRLVGLGSGPALGRVLEVGERYLTYEAYPESLGTDTFFFDVVDSLGARARGELRVGVAQPSLTNTPPVAVVDEVTVRPGRTAQVAALANDFDVDGDTLSFASGAAMQGGLSSELVDGRELSITMPVREGVYIGGYDVVDARGERAHGDLRVTVDAAAPLLPPVARDDSVEVSSLIDRSWVEVDVLANDYDPDGPRDQLTVKVPRRGGLPDAEPRVSADGTSVSVPVLERMQQIRYEVTDGDGNTSSALIIVPGMEDSVPVLTDPSLVLQATAGEPLTIDLSDRVAGTRGRQVRLTTESNLSATHGHLVAGGDRSVKFTPDAEYAGPASVVFEVIDAASDASGKAAFISIPVAVTHPADRSGDNGDEDVDRLNLPPVLVVDQPALRVGPDEGEASLSLLSLFRDPEGDTMFLSGGLAGGTGTDISWRLDGDTLRARAPIGARPDTSVQVHGLMVDAMDNETPFTVTISVVASTRPVATVVTDTVDDAAAGRPVAIPVLANDHSNLLHDTSLHLLGATTLSGEGTVTFNAEAGTVTVTPAAGWHGPLVASYTVVDATMAGDRRVDGTIRVQVLDRPGRPSTPFEAVAGDGQVSVKYLPGGDGGSPVTARTATATSPGLPSRNAECGIGVCTVTGLRNGVGWRISVVETNEVGPSEASPESAAVIPDAVPLAPSRPDVSPGDGELTVTWTHDPQYASDLGGSAIAAYLITLTDGEGRAVGSPAQVSGDSRRYTWQGLANGTPYTATVVARNSNAKAPMTSPPSDRSVPQTPAGLPRGSVVPRVTSISDGIGGGFSVTFPRSAVDDNGAAVSSFAVTPVTASGPQTDRARVVQAPGSGDVTAEIHGMGQTPVRFTLEAVNRVGRAVVGGTTDYQVSYPLPVVVDLSVDPGDGSLRVSATTNIDGSAARLEYRLDGGAWAQLPDSGTLGGLTNGRAYDVSVRARVGDQTSEAKTVTGRRPRSDRPAPPSLGDRTLVDFSRVEITTSLTWESTGGWDPAGYRFCSPDSGCTPDDTATTRRFTPGEAGVWRWSYPGFPTASVAVDLTGAPVTLPRFVGDDLEFRFPYVASGRCTVVLDGGRSSFTVNTAGGELFYRNNPTYKQDGQVIKADSADVSCTAGSDAKAFPTALR